MNTLSDSTPTSATTAPWGLTADAAWTAQAKALVGASGLALVGFAAVATVLATTAPKKTEVVEGPQEVQIAVPPKPKVTDKPAGKPDSNSNTKPAVQPAVTPDALPGNVAPKKPAPTDVAQGVSPQAVTPPPFIDVNKYGRPFGGQARQIEHGARLQAEDFNNGGEGVAYHDTAAKKEGGFSRQGAVDGGKREGAEGERIGWTANGEWLNYTVRVQGGVYDIDVRFSSGAKSVGNLELLMTDGAGFTSLGVFGLNNTGGWAKWATKTIKGINIPGGDQVLRLHFMGGNTDIDYLDFRLAGQPFAGSQSSGASPEPFAAAEPEALPEPPVIDGPPIQLLGAPIVGKTAVIVMATKDIAPHYGLVADALALALKEPGAFPVAVYAKPGGTGGIQTVHRYAYPGPDYVQGLRGGLNNVSPTSERGLWPAVDAVLKSKPAEIILISAEPAGDAWGNVSQKLASYAGEKPKISVIQINSANVQARKLTQSFDGRFKAMPLSQLKRHAGK